ncbi:MAG: MBL fold metallo-hydrolase [Calditrichaeota bacterium]|nr:MBL fold metallo-hydrolase [Calditrichota bacterium]MCB0292156.1 MBL fold metallo-hydrolase [Calditrichota bacterium]MCB0294416.1 MBL fold metallo-hydrolase [Calditrichota bacterium]MCB0303493.1 MBL fold metallo-hydrolase [Calditrichota bacterium]MCB0316606.1 MBL fold metallo-hydrolase [Calditrichota bacterium]
MDPIKIKFWGVRGSIPTPGPHTIRYGGNTSCVEINFPGVPRFIIDAGSGIRELGKELLLIQEPVKSYIFLSHFHWDHIQGLPFFKAAFKPVNHFVIFGCDEPDVDLTKIISMQMNPIYFPVAVDDMAARIEFRTIKEERFEVDGVTVQTQFMNHPGYTLGYRFNYQGKSVVYISDNEPFFQNRSGGEQSGTLEDRFERFIDDKEERLVEFIAGADLFIHDTQYFPDEYEQRITWGHSPYTYTVDLAVKGQVKQLVLFHHDPDHDDETVDRMAELSRQRLKNKGYVIPCFPAQERAVITL